VKIKTVGLIGLGRFGAMAYRYLEKAAEVRVYDADSERLELCRDAASFEQTIRADAVVLAVPISSLREVCRRMAPALRPGQLIIDTCSVKERPLHWMVQELPDRVQILGTHPLFGPDSGKAGISGLKIALCPVRVEEELYRQVKGFLSSLGLQVVETTAEEHDVQIARTQAVFHLIAQAFKRLGWGSEEISTPGPDTFFKLVRTVQNDTEQLFVDLQLQNRYASQLRQEFLDEVLRIDAELKTKAGGAP
jgi:prephenate dehydrogenase